MKNILLMILGLSFCMAVPCSADEKEPVMMEEESSMIAEKGAEMMKETMGTIATAMIKSTEEDSNVAGVVTFIQKDGSLEVEALITGLTTVGDHGIHIHEFGSCDDQGKAAGGHFNPKNVKHGYLPNDGAMEAHLGDMGNITVNENGVGVLKITMPNLTLNGENGIAGHAVILHGQPDDFGQPTGNAGGRIGCGVIEAAIEQ